MIAPIKYPGAKWSYLDWIMSYIPEHKVYLEPFCGSCAVLLNKVPVRHETINDIDGLVVNFFRACRDYPEELARAITLTPFARQEYESIMEAKGGDQIQITGDCVEDARRFAVRCAQGFGSKLACRVGWKNTKHSAGPSNPKIWSKLPDTIAHIAKRLKDVQIECKDAVGLIKAYNASNCLIYADPPYLGETRGGKLYRYEMMEKEEHKRLLDALKAHMGPVILSGYDNDLYNGELQGWTKAQKRGHANNAAARTETLWMNFEYQMRLEG